MPSGKTHTRIDLFFLIIIIGIGACFWGSLVEYFGRDEMVEYGTVFVIAYLFGTFLLSPDLDLKASDPLKNWGILRLLWRPYSHIFKHRGLSHTPIVGTLTRVLYIFVVVYALAAMANAFFDLGWKMSFNDLKDMDFKIVIWALAGLCLPDLFHILADHTLKNAR